MVFVVATMFLESIGFGLAFLKTGGRSLPALLVSALQFSVGPKTYIWKKDFLSHPQATPKEPVAYAPQPLEQEGVPTKITLVSESKIKNLATKVETKR